MVMLLNSKCMEYENCRRRCCVVVVVIRVVRDSGSFVRTSKLSTSTVSVLSPTVSSISYRTGKSKAVHPNNHRGVTNCPHFSQGANKHNCINSNFQLPVKERLNTQLEQHSLTSFPTISSLLLLLLLLFLFILLHAIPVM